MSRISFNITRDKPWYRSDRPVLRYLFGDSLKKALNDSCSISLEINGQSGNKRRTSWGQNIGPAQLLSFLKRYRKKPDGKPDQEVREGLHNFLFAERFLDGPFVEAFASDLSTGEPTEIIIKGDITSLPLIVNVPWELTDGIASGTAHPNVRPPLNGTLASLSLARVIRGTTASLNPAKESLRVVYCISQPHDLDPVQAPEFKKMIENVLDHRSGRLSYASVIEGDFTPRFEHLKAQIDESRPHILILVCHGQTSDGVSQLCFEKWYPVSELADALAQTQRTFFVLMIACDQAYLDVQSTAHSGAIAMLDKGILSVVAMQSSVDVLLAKQFLSTTLDWFFKRGTIALSVAQGRMSMAPTQAYADKYVDWSFPALFLTEDAHQQTDRLARIIDGETSTLEEMQRRIPRPDIYFPRDYVDGRLNDFLKAGSAGLREVVGALHRGKSTAIRNACWDALGRAARSGDTSARKILYVDFERYGEMPQTASGLIEILRKQTDEIHSSSEGATLLDWISRGRGTPIRSSPQQSQDDFEGVGKGQAEQVQRALRLIDKNKMVLVLDNIQAASFWPQFFEGAKSLIDALVIRIESTLSTFGSNVLEVRPLSFDETADYIKLFAPQQIGKATTWHDRTGGVLGFLDLLRKSREGEGATDFMDLKLFAQDLSESEKDTLFTMVHLPNGLDSELATAYVGADWLTVLRLDDKGLLLREARFDISSSWFRLPGMVTQSLRAKDQEQVAKACQSLADSFLERINPDEESDVEQNYISLAKKRGGIDFLHDIQQVLLGLEPWEEYWQYARSIPLLLHGWLLGQGRWHDAYKLWKRALTRPSLEDTEGPDWLKLADAARILGRGKEAEAFIKNARDRGLTKLKEIDALILEVAIIKDQGDSRRAAEVSAKYEEIIRTIDAAQGQPGFYASDLAPRRAITVYNRALHRRYWLRDLSGALADLDEAASEFQRLGDEQNQALANLEWVEIQLDWKDVAKDWAKMLELLVNANKVFAAGDGSPGDRAFCYYQLARYYRRKPSDSDEESRENIVKAREAYQRAFEQASLVGDLRQKAIAEAHLIEVGWRHLKEMEDAEATSRLDEVIGSLKTLSEDVWSARVLRDSLLLRSHVARALYPGTVPGTLQEAWAVACQRPLHPRYGADARRAARILFEYLNELESSKDPLTTDEVRVGARNLVEEWLSTKIEPDKPQTWLSNVEQLSIGPGEYYGKPKNTSNPHFAGGKEGSC